MKTHTTKTKSNTIKWWLAIVVLSSSLATVLAQNCKAGYTYALDEPNKTFTFTNTSTGTGPLTYHWYFGDGTSSTEQNPIHTYAQNGWIAPFLQVFGPDSCYSYYGDTIMLGACWSALSVSGYMNTLSPDFYNYSEGAEYYLWSFGDGSTSTEKTPTHTYVNYGTYNVCLTIGKSDSSCSDTKCFTYNAYSNSKNCYANFNAYQYSNGTYSFTDSSYATYGAHYLWEFGDGSSSTTHYPSHTYQDSGAYIVCLTVYSNDSTCYSKKCKTIHVSTSNNNSACNATFQYTQQGNTIYLNNTSTGNYSGAWWKFSDEENWRYDNGYTVAHTFPAAGYYEIALALSDTNMWCDSAMVSIYVDSIASCVANFGYYVDTIPGQANSIGVYFWDSSTNNANAGYSYQWSFGDGSTSTLQNPTHVYSNAGTYQVCFTFTSSDTMCKGSVCKNVNVQIQNTNHFQISFTNVINPTCNLAQPGSATAVVSGGATPYSYSWFNGQTTATATGLGVGTYSVAVTDGANHMQYAYVTLTQQSSLKVSISVSVDPTDNSVDFHSIVTGDAGGLSYMWYLGEDSAYAYTSSPKHKYANEGFYTICMSVYDSLACSAQLCDTLHLFTDSLGNYHAALLRLGQQATTVNELNNKVQIGVYPNPAKDEATVNFVLKQESQIEVSVCDLLGNVVAILDNGMRKDGTYTYNLNTTELSEGVYFVKLNNGGVVSTQKVVVVK